MCGAWWCIESVTKRLRLTHEFPDANSRHIFQNFGEDLWRLMRDNKCWTVDIEEIDRADHCFDVMVRSSALKRSVGLIEDLLSKHFLRNKVRIDIVEE